MAKRSNKTKIEFLFSELQFFWDILRNTKEYVEDVEKWSGRKCNEWANNETVVNFPYNPPKVKDIDKLENYDFDYYFMCNQLPFSDEDIETFKSLCGVDGGRDLIPEAGTWHKYSVKYNINLPYNPKLKKQSFDSNRFFIAQKLPITILNPSLREWENCLLWMDLRFPDAFILNEVQNILKEARSMKKELWIKKHRVRASDFKDYLNVYSAKEKYGLTHEKVLDSKFGRLDDYYSKVKATGSNRKALKELIS
ncbi:hypothetical protein ACFL0P_04765 [Candidatus Omnitrophota bacterium]